MGHSIKLAKLKPNHLTFGQLTTRLIIDAKSFLSENLNILPFKISYQTRLIRKLSEMKPKFNSLELDSEVGRLVIIWIL